MAREILNKGPIRKAKSRNPIIHFDKLPMYFGEPFIIDFENLRGKVIIYSPTIGDIVEKGETRFYSTLSILTTNTTANRLMLWENGLDWNEVSDFELFSLLIKGVDKEVASLFFGELDISNFDRKAKETDDGFEMVLYNEDADVEINERAYFYISQYIRTIFNYFPEEKLTDSNFLKKAFIDKDKRQKDIDAYKAQKGDNLGSHLQSQISSFVSHPGTKYKLRELKEVGVCEFFDTLQRLQIYESATACMKGMYSGFVDGKKIKPEDYNFMREIK